MFFSDFFSGAPAWLTSSCKGLDHEQRLHPARLRHSHAATAALPTSTTLCWPTRKAWEGSVHVAFLLVWDEIFLS